MKHVPRTRSVVAREATEDDKTGSSKKTLKMWRYRNNLRNYPDRLEKMREDRERKREEQRNKILNGDRNLEKELKEKHKKKCGQI